MSLLDESRRIFVRMAAADTPDGAGGRMTVWTAGESFPLCLIRDTSTEGRRAEQEGMMSVYTGLVDQSVEIHYDDYFRDESTGITYRVTSDPAEKRTPSCSTLALKVFTAERRELPA